MESLALIVLQGGFLYLIWWLSVRGATTLLHRMLNPYCWFIGFYSLWFLLPQLTGLAFDHHILGMEKFSSSQLRDVYRSAQGWLLVFLASTAIAQTIFLQPLSRRSPGINSARDMLRISGALSYRFYLFTFFTVGVLATLYVATLNIANLDGYRSDIVKTLPGQIATALGYLGAFAFAYLALCAWKRHQWPRLVLYVVVFSGAILLTGARGRLLWPLLIIAMFVIARSDRVSVVRTLLLGVAGIAVLLSIDPIVALVKFGPGAWEFSAERFFSPLVFKRNFDGFANFAMISAFDDIRYDWHVLFTGARDTFMDAYFPIIYALGVGFGSTVPGLFWIAGGPVGLMIGGAFYSLLLGGLNLWLRTNHSNLLFWSYLFIMPWLGALGGNLIESLDKMLVAGIGPILIYLAHGGDGPGTPQRTGPRPPNRTASGTSPRPRSRRAPPGRRMRTR